MTKTFKAAGLITRTALVACGDDGAREDDSASVSATLPTNPSNPTAPTEATGGMTGGATEPTGGSGSQSGTATRCA